jgi:glutathione S-transferase
MPTLLAHEVTNSAVKTFKGLHLYHSKNSHCCRQVRLALSLKQIQYTSHDIDINSKNENVQQDYIGINPRGLVPTLVHEGKVIVETIDILLYVDKTFSTNNDNGGAMRRLIPGPSHDRIVRLVECVDELQMCIRTITIGRLPRGVQQTKAKGMQLGLLGAMTREQNRSKNDAKNEDGSIDAQTTAAPRKNTFELRMGGELESNVRGQNREQNLMFWKQISQRDFNKKERAMAYTHLFDAFMIFENRLKQTQHLLGNNENDVLTLVDVAWWPVVGRFYNVLKEKKKTQFRKHAPNVWEWYERLKLRPEFKIEVESDSLLLKMIVGYKETTNVSNVVALSVFIGSILLLWFMIKFEM